MRMTLDELRAFSLEWMNDPKGDEFAPGRDYTRLDLLINAAVQELATEIDHSREAWSVPPEANHLAVTIVDGTREYELDALAEAPIRRVLEVRDATGSESSLYPKLDIVNYPDRNAASSGVYVFRGPGTSGHAWYVGLVLMPSTYSALQVATVPSVTRLVQSNDVPGIIPDEFHEVICYRTAMTGLKQDSDFWQEVADLYVQGRQALVTALAHPMGQLESGRL